MKRLCVIAGMLLPMFLGGVPAHAQKNITDVQAKLIIINHFVSRYVRWPGRYSLDHVPQIYICGLGKDEVTENLMLLERASTNKLKVFVETDPALKMVHECHVLYIAESEKLRVKSILNHLRNYPVLTMSSINRFAHNGGMVELGVQTQYQVNFEKNYVRYSINMDEVRRLKIQVDPDAVELAKEVIE